jgi:hypothetical protein
MVFRNVSILPQHYTASQSDLSHTQDGATFYLLQTSDPAVCSSFEISAYQSGSLYICLLPYLASTPAKKKKKKKLFINHPICRPARWNSRLVLKRKRTNGQPSLVITNKVTQRSRVLLKKVTDTQLVKEFAALKEPEGSLPHSQEPATGRYPEPDSSSPYLPVLFLWNPY